MIENKKPKLCVVGGGTAGWITLAYLVATVDADFTIIHSEEIDPIGVGESTTPTIKHVAETCGVDEFTWMRDANATFKYGVHYQDWNRPGSSWFHCFDDLLPHQNWTRAPFENGKRLVDKELTSVEYFLKHYKTGSEFFNRSQGASHYLWHEKLSPFDQLGQANTSRYPGYAYHVDASKFGDSLRRNTDPTKYQEIVNTVTDVRIGEHGIESLLLKDGTTITADLYFDCTGFKRLLIDKLTKWEPYSKLVNNAAVFGRVVGRNSDNATTIAHAQPVGWIWTIPTWQNTGSGYVYSDQYINDDQAVDHMTKYWKQQGHDWEPAKQIKFVGGRQQHCSIKNVVANGLSQSFVEPLEATSIMVTCSTVVKFVELYKRNNSIIDAGLIRMHDRVIEKFLLHMKNFVVYHYALNGRQDTAYWLDHQDANASKEVSEKIKELLSQPWLQPGETAYNQWNWASMLLGYDKLYSEDLPDIPDVHIENYVDYTESLIHNYKRMLGKNITVADMLRKIHQPNDIT